MGEQVSSWQYAGLGKDSFSHFEDQEVESETGTGLG